MCKFSFILGIAAFIIEPAFAQSPPDLSKMTQTFDYEFQWSGIGFEHFARNYTTPATINNELEAYTPTPARAITSMALGDFASISERGTASNIRPALSRPLLSLARPMVISSCGHGSLMVKAWHPPFG